MHHQPANWCKFKRIAVLIFLVSISLLLSYHGLPFIEKANRTITPQNEGKQQIDAMIFEMESNQTLPFNIFMVETNEKSKAMTLKQMCSIESAARHNPEATLYVNSLKAEIQIKELFTKYPNIKWALMNIVEIFKDTPLKQWWVSDKLAKHDEYYKYSHLSDALRLALIYKHGGVYTDLDHIAIKNFQPLIKFSAIINNNPTTIVPESSFFHVAKNHAFLKFAIEDFAKNYNPSDWGGNGPLLLQRCIKKYCKTEEFNKLLIKPQANNVTSAVNCDIGMLPYHVAYPYQWSEAYKMFEPNANIEVSRFLNSFTIHFNSKVTSNHVLKHNDNSVIEFFMAHNCPIVYKNIPKYNN